MKNTVKANELRIGNWVSSKDTAVQIEEITSETVRYCYGEFTLDFINPIPITKEVLLRFGFEFKVVYGNNFWQLGKIVIFEDKKGNFEWSVGLKLQSIHQLQNLYFALIRRELKLKDGGQL